MRKKTTMREKKIAKLLDQQLEDQMGNLGEDTPEEIRVLIKKANDLRGQRNDYLPRPGYVTSTRSYIEERISQTDFPSRKRIPLYNRRTVYRIMLSLIGAMCLFIFSTGVALASESALPGDSLYGVKTFVDDTRLALTLNPMTDIALRMKFAQEHLVEYATLVADGRHDDARVALQNYDRYIVGAARQVQSLTNQPQAAHMVSTFNKTIQQDVIIIENLYAQTP